MSNKYEMTGTIVQISETQTFPSGFQKREFVIETGGQYSDSVKFAFVKDKCEILDRYQVRDKVTVSFNVRGNEYKGRHYVDLQAWRIEREDNQAQPATAQAPAQGTEENDEIPF